MGLTEEPIGKDMLCPHCRLPIQINTSVLKCSDCGTPHHAECWDANHGCTTFACKGSACAVTSPQYGSLSRQTAGSRQDSAQAGDALATLMLEEQEFHSALQCCLFCASKKPDLPHIQGVMLHRQGSGRVVCIATDTYRLSVFSLDGSRLDGRFDRVFVPSSIASELASSMAGAAGSLTIALYPKELHFLLSSGKTISSSLLAVNFPNYDKALPATVKATLEVNREDLRNAVRSLHALAITDDSRVILTASNANLRVTTRRHNDLEEIDARLVEGTLDNGKSLWRRQAELAIAVKSDYLIDALESIRAQRVRLGVTSSTSQILITSPEVTSYQHVLMPMTL